MGYSGFICVHVQSVVKTCKDHKTPNCAMVRAAIGPLNRRLARERINLTLVTHSPLWACLCLCSVVPVIEWSMTVGDWSTK